MSKYLEYTRYANTSATADSAPVLGRFVNRDKPALEALCEEIKLNGGTPMDTETLLYIISGTLDYIREQYALRCVRYRLFGITFEVACYGPFETADAKFDPARNSLEVAVRLGDEIRNCLVNETPTLVTEETASTARIYRAMDIESGALGIVIGGRKFRVTGRNVYVSREGESLKLQDGKGRLFDIAYDKIESPQRVEGHLVEPPEESGTCKLILTTFGGDESEDAKLGIYERVVSFVKFDEPKRYLTVDDLDVSGLGEGMCRLTLSGISDPYAVKGCTGSEGFFHFAAKVYWNGEELGEKEFGSEGEGIGITDFEHPVAEGDTIKVVLEIDPAKTDYDQTPVEVVKTI